MASELSTWLARFVEIYQQSPDDGASLKCFLDRPFIWAEDEDDALDLGTVVEDASRGSKRARQLVSKRIPGDAQVEAEFQILLRTFEPQRSLTIEEAKDHFQEEREMVAEIAEEAGVSEAEVRAQLAKLRIDRKREQLRSPDLSIYFLKKFAALLDSVVEKTRNLEELSYRDVLSEELRGLFQEAHYCYLYGLESSSAIMCGAILEEGFRKRCGYGSTQRLKLEEVIFNALEEGVISHEIFEMADEIREMRNLAAHDPKGFKDRSAGMRATILSNTRSVVKALLEG